MKFKAFALAFLLTFALVIHAQTVPLNPAGELMFSTTNVAADTISLTNTQMVGLLTGTPTAAANYTTRTAVQACAYFRNIVPPNVANYSWDLWIKNTSGGANTITVVAGSGFTLVGTGTAAQNNVRHLKFVLTNCTSGSEAGSIISLETAAF